ncbi:ATP-dependent DNA helicase [Embleya sp. NPDC005575]|uniref:ATP-dependent helicase n=1 Tax=Embleya sp. NPDC005575 TaxID=3156892 RepID=UPI0033A30162
MTTPTPAYRLRRTPVAPPAPVIPDDYQRAVVEHRGGPLLVLAGPGTGKTTVLVEAVAARVARGIRPEEILVLTFGRKAAGELRDRLTARLRAAGARTAAVPTATTFHSFCYALVREHQPAELFSYPLRLLTGPEQDVFVRELLAGGVEEGSQSWPAELRAAVGTRGFADEVRAVIARSRELGLDPDALARFAQDTGRRDWRAAADFLAEYLDVIDAQGVVDYAELVHRAVLLAERPETAQVLRGRYKAVFVDEYQDTDPAQVRLLAALAGDGRDLIAVGDPDQSIYAFRGADVNGILDFPHRFPRADGEPADIVVLRTSRRAPAGLLAASRVVTQRMPLSRLPGDRVRAHRELIPSVSGAEDPSRVEVYTYPTPGAELDNTADILRRAHLEDGVPWGQMAVLVRSGARSIPGLRRALSAAGVPLEIAGDELPIAAEQAVSPLLTALHVAAEPSVLDAETARALLQSPLGGLDAGDLRLLGRALRAEERAASGAAVAGTRPSAELIRDALAEPGQLVGIEQRVGGGALRLGMLIRKAREVLAGGGGTEDALWELWQGTPWPGRLERAVLRGGTAGRNADRDLDAVVALFEVAAKAEERAGHRGALNFLAELKAQQIPGDRLDDSALRGESVRLLTAHRAKGLQWRLVVVHGVQEGLWPDLRRRGSLLEADRIGSDGLAEPLSPGALLAEERRLFYVAVTRAKERLVVTAVDSSYDDGDQPSRFLEELGVPPVEVKERPRRPLSTSALVAELRSAAVDPLAPAVLRRAAARRLAALADLRDDEGHALVPAAHPDRWWGLVEPTDPGVPIRDPGSAVRLSGSSVAKVRDCALSWFLGSEVHADSPRSAALGFGNVVHALADEVGTGATSAELPVLMDRLDRVWDALAFEAPWQSEQQKDEARTALERFLSWHTHERHRVVAATEHGFEVELTAGEYRVLIRGSMDRVERGEDGLAYVVDFKTGRRPPTRTEVEEHPQLAVYQVAVAAGALDEVPGFEGGRPAAGGAELIQLRSADKGDAEQPLVLAQDPPLPGPDGGTWVGGLLADVAGRILGERFTPSTGSHCDRCDFRRCCSARPEGRMTVD